MINLVLKSRIIELFRTQADFAAYLGTKDTIVSQVVNGRRELSQEAKERWAEALDSTTEELFHVEVRAVV